jgi:hypothetical protein
VPGFIRKKHGTSGVLEDGFGYSYNNGYLYRLYLPGGVSDQGKGKKASPIKSLDRKRAIDGQEKSYVFYAWPLQYGETGNKAFIISSGTSVLVYDNNDQRFSANNAPSFDVALDKSANDVYWIFDSSPDALFQKQSRSNSLPSKKMIKKEKGYFHSFHFIVRSYYLIVFNGVTGKAPLLYMLLALLVMSVIVFIFFNACQIYRLLDKSPIYGCIPILSVYVLAKAIENPKYKAITIFMSIPMILSILGLKIPLIGLVFSLLAFFAWIRLNISLAEHFDKGILWTIALVLFPYISHASLYRTVKSTVN